MSGIVFNKPLQDEPSGTFLEQVKKNEESKKRKNFKFIFTIVISNLFVATIFYSPSKEPADDVTTATFISHTGYQMMTLNISPVVQLDQSSKEHRISLLNSKKKVVLRLGYLHEELKNEQDPSLRRFKVEVPEKETLEISAYADEKLVAIPAVSITQNTYKPQGSSYEINL